MTIGRLKLPIDPILPQARALLESGNCLVLHASPGSGKTTRVPPALLDTSFRRPEQEILVLEPRRLAAKYAARRVAEELGEEVGRTIGYQFRFENVSSAATRIRFLTEGMLMRRLLAGHSDLKNVAAVLLDEFHERHLHGDVALAFLRRLQLTTRPDLRIVVMSATLDSAEIATYLGGCPVLKVDTPVHPVRIEHASVSGSALGQTTRPLDRQVRDACIRAAERSDDDEGDILVFLPGMAEIRRCESALGDEARARGWDVLPLHGELTREEQDRAMRSRRERGAGGATVRRKIILATNVAETSLTIEGVTVVIDSGLARIASYSWWSGVPALRTRAVSRASAIQRAGRAGRTAPGTCYRLYSQGDFDSRPPYEVPEIRRSDLTQTLLELLALGIGDLAAFPWFERPSAESQSASLDLLRRLGGVAEGAITPTGRELVALPAHPRIGRMLIEARKHGVLEDAATLGALISEGRIERLDAISELRSARGDEGLRRVKAQWLSALKASAAGAAASRLNDPERALRFALLTGFPDRVAQRRVAGKDLGRALGEDTELVLSAGGSARVATSSPVLHESDTFVVLDIQEKQHHGQARAKLLISAIVPIDADWLLDLEPSGVVETDALEWDSARGRLRSIYRMQYDQLVLSESITEATPEQISSDAAGAIVLREALGLSPAQLPSLRLDDWIAALARLGDRELIETAFARIQLLRTHFPEWNLPDLHATGLDRWLAPLFAGRHSLADLKSVSWEDDLPATLAPEHAGRLAQLVPVSLTLPNGRRARIHYRLSQDPWVESRLQDFFGMKKGPRILEGKLPLVLHLLAPNQRAVQVTKDLEGFWQRGYQELRTQLSRRYPRHKWPESPLEAEPPELKKR